LVGRMFAGRSWIVLTRDGNGVEHLFVNFLKIGLRIPFTRLWAARWGAVQRGDLVLYHCAEPDRTGGEPLLGRVAGRGGETVTVADGKLCVNGAPLDGAAWLEQGKYRLNPGEMDTGKGGKKNKGSVPEG